jgi:SagB-type dehydrogenase family enzyme
MSMTTVDKLEFRLSQPGVRKLPAACLRVPLTPSPVLAKVANRRSHRRFQEGILAFDAFSTLLGCLAQRPIPDWPFPKYAYGSAGNLYPVQTYAYVTPGRVEAVSGGHYYYDPVSHALVELGTSPPLEPSRFGPNRAIVEHGAFVLFLVAHMAAITPIYGSVALRLASIEAGLITELLELTCTDARVGLCQLGGGDFDDLASRFQLARGDLFVHTLVGGQPEAAE